MTHEVKLPPKESAILLGCHGSCGTHVMQSWFDKKNPFIKNEDGRILPVFNCPNCGSKFTVSTSRVEDGE